MLFLLAKRPHASCRESQDPSSIRKSETIDRKPGLLEELSLPLHDIFLSKSRPVRQFYEYNLEDLCRDGRLHEVEFVSEFCIEGAELISERSKLVSCYQ